MTVRCVLGLLAALGWIASAGAASADSPLATAPSAFVRAQASSGIHWRLWNDATLAEARAGQHSVYVFVGSPLSELTRATMHQTFGSEKTMAWLNENFLCVFVDADAEPAVGALAQHFINSVKQLRGWPVHLWLTPDLRPYDGANYLPPSEEWGKPGFLKSARTALESWTVDPARARALAAEAESRLRLAPLAGASPAIPARLDRAAAGWLAIADAKHGGFGDAPKQPEPELLRFLLTRDPRARDAALRAARALAGGAVRDATDGGFYRRAIDEEWKVPYRQKTLADQARIALALLAAADAAKDETLRAAAFGALDFATKELRQPDGSFAAALDGTLDENADPTQRPAFVRAGYATTGAEGLLIAALQRTGEKRFTTLAAQLAGRMRDRLKSTNFALEHVAGQPAPATAADYLAVALAFRALNDPATAERLRARADELYFDAATGTYMATPAKLPPGFVTRVPALGESPTAAALALMVDAKSETATLLRRALLAEIEYDEQPAGDILLGLSAGP